MPTITMPQLGESVTEGTIGRWLKKVGDRVQRDEPIVEVITDKVNAEIPAPVAGVLERIAAREGAIVAVGEPIAFVVGDHELQTPPAKARPTDSGEATAVATPFAATIDAGTTADHSSRLSPLVRKLAREHNLDLRLIQGTGLGGRVSHDDVELYLAHRANPTPQSIPDTRIVPSPMRRTIAQRLSRSAREIPHAWLTVEVDVTGLVRFRDTQRERFHQTEGIDLSYLPFFAQATVESLQELPLLNSQWLDDSIVLKGELNLGVAVALDDGLVVPVVRGADGKSVVELAHAIAALVGRARAGNLIVDDVEGGTFTLNNTGAFGSIASQPIINYPQAAILNTEAIVRRPVVLEETIAIRSMMNLCLAFDHRILDGAIAGRFLQSVRRRLERWGPDSTFGKA